MERFFSNVFGVSEAAAINVSAGYNINGIRASLYKLFQTDHSYCLQRQGRALPRLTLGMGVFLIRPKP